MIFLIICILHWTVCCHILPTA